MIGDAAQYQELVALYGGYGDEELLTLGRYVADLTEVGAGSLEGGDRAARTEDRSRWRSG